MGSETSISLSKTLTLLIVLFYVVFQADCLGVKDQKMARLTTFGNNAIPNKPSTTTQAPSKYNQIHFIAANQTNICLFVYPILQEIDINVF